MPKALKAAESTFDQARKQLVRLSKQTTKALTRDRDRLLRQLRAVNARNKRLAARAQTKMQRLSKTTAKKAAKALKGQIAELKKLRAEAREEAKDFRAKLATVRVDLANARQYLSRGLHADKAMAAFERKLKKTAKRIKKTRIRKKSA